MKEFFLSFSIERIKPVFSPFPNSILEEACARVKAQEEEAVGGITLQSESKENLDADDEENAIPARREIPKLDFPEGFCDTPRPSPTNLLKKLAEDAKKKEEESIILPVRKSHQTHILTNRLRNHS